jgi:hypothetical protein
MKRVESEAVREALRLFGLALAESIATYTGLPVKVVRAALRSHRYEWCDRVDEVIVRGHVKNGRHVGSRERWTAAVWQYTGLDGAGAGVLVE